MWWYTLYEGLAELKEPLLDEGQVWYVCALADFDIPLCREMNMALLLVLDDQVEGIGMMFLEVGEPSKN